MDKDATIVLPQGISNGGPTFKRCSLKQCLGQSILHLTSLAAEVVAGKGEEKEEGEEEEETTDSTNNDTHECGDRESNWKREENLSSMKSVMR